LVRKKWECTKIIIKQHEVKTKEYDLLIDEVVAIIYSELIKSKSSPNVEVPHHIKGGTDAA